MDGDDSGGQYAGSEISGGHNAGFGKGLEGNAIWQTVHGIPFRKE
jgi:hypothetical protein